MDIRRYNIPSPQSIFDLDYFRENPQPFTHLARELFPGKYRPTPTHGFIRLLQDKGILHRVYTQNIDSLERIVGIQNDKLVEAHGTFAKAHCINASCQTEMDINEYRQGVISGTPPTCKQCHAYVKPDIVFFGEPLPHRFSILMETDFVQCDLLIVIGTSLAVQPFAGLVCKPLLTVPRLLINQHPVAMEIGFDPPVVKKLKTKGSRPELVRTGSGVTSTRGGTAQAEQEAEAQAAAEIASEMETNHLRGGFRFGSPENYRDVFMRGACDASIQRLVTACGWEREFTHVLERNKIPAPTAKSSQGAKGKGKGVRTTSSRTGVKK